MMDDRGSRFFPRRVYGVDFSGAADAGKKIWIATGEILGDTLQILQCRPAEHLPDAGPDREHCLPALRAFIAGQPDAVFGLDFPFGLPQALVEEGTWEDFVLAFSDHYLGPDEFRVHCRQAGGLHDLKRATDDNAHTPFSPYNLRVYKQTYYGIRAVLAPLVLDELAYVLPMQRPLPGRARIIEVCPASTLKHEHLYESYKGDTPALREARQRILQGIQGGRAISIPDAALQQKILDDPEGDALDSVVAAVAAFRAVRCGYRITVEDNPLYALEGHVYV